MLIADILATVILVIGNKYRYIGNSALGKANVILELVFAHFPENSRPKHSVMGVLTSFASADIHIWTEIYRIVWTNFRNSHHFFENEPNRVLLGVFFEHREVQPIYPNIIGPDIAASKSGIVLDWQRAGAPNNRYYRDISISIAILT